MNAVTKELLVELGFDSNRIITHNSPLMKMGDLILTAKVKEFESVEEIQNDTMINDCMVSGYLCVYDTWGIHHEEFNKELKNEFGIIFEDNRDDKYVLRYYA